MAPARLEQLNDEPEREGDYVLYWMQQSQREACNPALETALVHASRLGLPVLVGFGLMDGYPEANARHYAFMLEGLRDVAEALSTRGIGFVVQRGAPDEVAIALARRAALVVCDRGYLRHQKQWRRNVAEQARRRVIQVEGDVVVPVALASGKIETAARTLRPKLQRLREDFLQPLRRSPIKVQAGPLRLPPGVDLSDIPALLGTLRIDHDIGPVRRFRGGAREAQRRLAGFLDGPLDNYAEGRREPAKEQVSFLSAYLHFGQISPLEIALAVTQAEASRDDRAAYLEELLVRRELAMNFVEHQPHYDSYARLPDWAQRTLEAHRSDPRPHIYSDVQLAAAQTHDRYWNAAMREMRITGYMHNHMRMYWGKKILEWSLDPQKAFRTALSLNNRYFLCGRDPNSYANVAWCFGLHDRPWPERAIFGKVRSMTAEGLKRKIDIEAYVKRVEELAEAETG
ncbi:deoxyribodipyrimidine photo-lyase [Chelatococcus reniformis]|uniref:Deoxyribodipyrimidine photo-lyase n=1 Tax=Chelatococcus reniformis TaxID=1494448 RepID=A0A916XM42_9HYPH|nr:deoxyribodipyrimidine photo-lyase [Chelatococcus reniformis]GGC85904.1 deoxyribodipyrimidine photo-lyase [Chelatococcus reniformis]